MAGGIPCAAQLASPLRSLGGWRMDRGGRLLTSLLSLPSLSLNPNTLTGQPSFVLDTLAAHPTTHVMFRPAPFALLQEFHSRPAPCQVYQSAFQGSVFRDANAQLLDLASKSAQSRRKKRSPKTAEQQQQHFGPPLLTHTSPNQTTLRTSLRRDPNVFSEVMMNNEDTPKAAWTSSFYTQHGLLATNEASSSRSSSSNNTATVSNPEPRKGHSSRRRGSRQRPISRNGVVTANRTGPAPARTGAAVAPPALPVDEDRQRRRRSRVLTQALRKSREMREFNKSVDITLAASKLPIPCAAYGGNDDEDDEDWAAFITSGYGEFPLPPTHRPVSPARTSATATSSTARSDSTSMSSSTSATSLASSASLPKTGVDWLDDELAWASSDEEAGDEEKEVVSSPRTQRSSPAAKRRSGASDIFCTPSSSPMVDWSEPKQSERVSINTPLLSTLLSKAVRRGDQANDAKLLHNARIGAFGLTSDRHCSVSSTASSLASSAPSSEAYTAESASTRPSSASSASVTSTSPLQMVKAAIKSAPAPITPTRMTSLDHCVEVARSGAETEERPLLGDWLSNSARQPGMPRIEALGDTESCYEDTLEETGITTLKSKSAADLLRVVPSEPHRLRRSSRTSILANCPSPQRKPASLHGGEEERENVGQGTTGTLRSRLTAKLNHFGQRTSTPDVPVTPSSADSTVSVDATAGLSPSSTIFGMAAINARATFYATSTTPATSAPSSWQQRRRVSSQCAINNKAGFCFDYDPNSPLYLEGEQTPPPSSFWKRSNARVHDALPDESGTIRFPLLKHKGSFRIWK